MRLRQLDSVRAAAIALVMVQHYGGAALNAHIPIGAGPLGVGCFFTLSGFLITGILMEGFDAGPSLGVAWRNFYGRRLMRLVPAYYAVILLLVLSGIAPIARSWPWHAAYLTNVWEAFGNSSNVFWSLSVEEQFYLLWPAVIAFVPRRWLLPASGGLIAATLAFKLVIVVGGYSTKASDHLLLNNLTLLALGCMLAVVSYRGRPNDFSWHRGRVVPLLTVLAWTSLAVAVATWMVFAKASLVRYFTVDLLCGVFYAWLVLRAAIGFGGPIGWLLDIGAVQYVGRISYGLYLVHDWMPRIVEKLAGPMPKFVAAPIVLTATFAICILSWHFYEQPILRLRRRPAAAPLPTPAMPQLARPPTE
jgi:peptidoglycan/LPS O-acetylase OafA/YrhL